MDIVEEGGGDHFILGLQGLLGLYQGNKNLEQKDEPLSS